MLLKLIFRFHLTHHITRRLLEQLLTYVKRNLYSSCPKYSFVLFKICDTTSMCVSAHLLAHFSSSPLYFSTSASVGVALILSLILSLHPMWHRFILSCKLLNSLITNSLALSNCEKQLLTQRFNSLLFVSSRLSQQSAEHLYIRLWKENHRLIQWHIMS